MASIDLAVSALFKAEHGPAEPMRVKAQGRSERWAASLFDSFKQNTARAAEP